MNDVSCNVVGWNVEKSVVKAVTFDLWETLLFERDGSDSQRTAIRCRGLTKVLNGLGLNTSVEEVEAALKETMASLIEVWDNNEDVSHIDQIRLFTEYASRGQLILEDESLRELSAAYVLPLFEVPPYLNREALGALKWLRNQEKHIGIISNTGLTPGTELRRFLSKIGVSQYFRSMIFSNEVGIRKPDRSIFGFAAQALKAEPQQIVHIGDNLKSDVWGAKNAGFKAIYLSSTAGRDKIAESDPSSLVSLSRSLGGLNLKQIEADKTISSLSLVKQAVEEIEANA